jgi:tetraacyldisaccharide 4'-kinase
MKSPAFWNTHGKRAKLLSPIGKIYGELVQKRLKTTKIYASSLPVVCVGNVTMGGSGKTPVVDALIQLMQRQGKAPAVLMRGYGGTAKGPLWVDAATDAALCGDEALLHARVAPTMVSADRAKGAKAIEENKAITHIVMDDGLQNPSLHKTRSILVIDGNNPFGNGRVFPAGPLRETANDAVRRVDAVVIMGQDVFNLELQYQFLLPVFKARMRPVNGHEVSGKPVFAFAGIGKPKKFFDSLRDCDAVIMQEHAFADHHPFTREEIEPIVAQAEKARGIVVTTRKDWVRLPQDLQQKIKVLDVAVVWENEDAVLEFLTNKVN